MSLTPHQIELLIAGVLRHVHDAEYDLLKAVTQRIAKDVASGGLRAFSIAQLQREARRVVSRLRGDSDKAVRDAIDNAYRGNVADVVSILSGFDLTPAVRADPAAIAALERALNDRLEATYRRILRWPNDVYRQVIGRATGYALSGDAGTRLAAAQSALDEFAARGVTGFVDAAGNNWNLASYTEMATRTSILNAGREGRFQAVIDAGRDLVVVSYSANPCHECEIWEGEVLSLSGGSMDYPSLDEASGGHLFGPNCTHSADPWVEGLTQVGEPNSEPELYDAVQEQRYLERGIRSWKMREAASLNDISAAQARAKVREWQARMREHVAQNDLRRLYYREQIGKAI